MKKIYCDIKKCIGCRACEIACAVEHSKSKKLDEAIKERPLPIKRRKAESIEGDVPRSKFPKITEAGNLEWGIVISTGCHHCEDAPCVAACMSSAMYKDKKTGQTKHDEEKCVGCWMCIMSCPFGALSRQKQDKIIVKCDLCPDRDIPACVEACQTAALFLGTEKEFKKKLCNT
ncbi:MAG: 4Fe-4S dicluster domain-containing protein [Candidatus Gorgyraea atricola]|nr:4Fe-4S dicluster domain-containing protein [Candidatus Gorgyraea atricola]